MHVVAPTASLIAAVPVAYYVFDVLRLDGRSTLELPYLRRRETLAALAVSGDAVQSPEHYTDVAGWMS
jgi:bifunctional non-homologous end joining protein LigD